MMNIMFSDGKLSKILATVVVLHTAIFFTETVSASEDSAVKVNVENFVRAETAAQFDRALQMTGGINKWLHFRQPTPLDKQSVIRMNRDTLYSAAIVDISKGATFTMPDSKGRYMSVMVVNEDHYINKVIHEPGVHKLTVKEYDTPYVNLSVRTLVDASDPEDIKKANALQDQLRIEAVSARPYSHPNYEQESYQSVYKMLLALGKDIPDARNTFGKRQDVDPVRHLLATAWGWGGLPEYEASYLNVEPNMPVGAYRITVKDVPVDAFWSVSVYNKDGYFEKNEYDAYSVNSVSGKPNEDGSFTIHLGGDASSVNFLSITKGWNYVVRLYQPRKEVLDGSWSFPEVEKMK